MPAAVRTPDAEPAPDRRGGTRLRPRVLVLGLLAGAASVAACLWLAFATSPQVGATTPGLVGLGLALVGPLGLLVTLAAYIRHQQAARAEAQQQRLQRRRATLDLLDLLPVAVALCDLPRGRVSVNRAMAHLLRIEAEQRTDLALDWQALIAAEDGPAWQATAALAQQSGQAQWLHCTLRAAGIEQPVLAQIAPVDGEDGPQLVVGLTPRQGEAGLAQQAVLQLRDLLSLAEAEQWKFGQAVHDELGQRLSGMAYFAKSLQRRLQQAQRAEADDAGWLTGLANESMSVARGLARGLVPVGTDDPGALAAALEEVCEHTRRNFDIRCELHVDPGFEPGGATQANHLYHAVQELVTNACKHGHARDVQVRLEVEDDGQRVTVRNDGRSLGAPPPRGGMGLNGVRSRVAYLGGRFTLADEPGGGVKASITLPLSAAAPRAAAGPGTGAGVANPSAET
jgi:signal transduction histidine kinase